MPVRFRLRIYSDADVAKSSGFAMEKAVEAPTGAAGHSR